MGRVTKGRGEPGTDRQVASWDLQMSLEICEDVAGGKTLTQACGPKTPGRVVPSTFLRWCITIPELGAAFKLAREISGHMLEDEALDMARKLPELSGPAPEMSAKIRALDVAMGQLRWSAGKRHPREYGDKAQTTFTVPIQINTSIPLEMGKGLGPQELADLSREARGEFVVEATVLPPEALPGVEAEPEPEPLPGSVYDGARRVGKIAKPGAKKGKGNPAIGAAMRRRWREGKYENHRRPEHTEKARAANLEKLLERKLEREAGDGVKEQG